MELLVAKATVTHGEDSCVFSLYKDLVHGTWGLYHYSLLIRYREYVHHFIWIRERGGEYWVCLSDTPYHTHKDLVDKACDRAKVYLLT